MTTEQQIDSQELPYQTVTVLSADQELYIRRVTGEGEYLPATEAIQQFISDAGYRIIFEFSNGVRLILRRNCFAPDVDQSFNHNYTVMNRTFECEVTVSGDPMRIVN